MTNAERIAELEARIAELEAALTETGTLLEIAFQAEEPNDFPDPERVLDALETGWRIIRHRYKIDSQ